MTKNYTAAVSLRFAGPDLLGKMPLGILGDESLIWNFEFWPLGFIWDLVLGSWNLRDFFNDFRSVNHLFNWHECVIGNPR